MKKLTLLRPILSQWENICFSHVELKFWDQIHKLQHWNLEFRLHSPNRYEQITLKVHFLRLVNDWVLPHLLVLVWDISCVHCLLNLVPNWISRRVKQECVKVFPQSEWKKRAAAWSLLLVPRVFEVWIKSPFNNTGFSKWLDSSLWKKRFKFHLKLIVRIALYHCCPVSRSKRSVAIYLLPCDSPYVTICL